MGFVSVLPLFLIMNPRKFSSSVSSLNIALFTEGGELSSKKKKRQFLSASCL
jgi:hypothetical protein